MKPSAAQFRAARALLGWSQSELAKRCKVGVNTIGRLETGERAPGERIQEDLIELFEDAGVVFTFAGSTEGVAITRAEES